MTTPQSTLQNTSINKNNHTIDKLEQVRQKISVLRFLDFGETFTEQQSDDRETYIFDMLTGMHDQISESISYLENKNEI